MALCEFPNCTEEKRNARHGMAKWCKAHANELIRRNQKNRIILKQEEKKKFQPENVGYVPGNKVCFCGATGLKTDLCTKCKYRFNIAFGLCGRCGNKEVVSGKVHCEGCLNKSSNHERNKRDNRIKAGLCDKCGNKRGEGDGKASCRKCLDKACKNLSGKKERLPKPEKPKKPSKPEKREGFCLGCRINPVKVGRNRIYKKCEVCLNKTNERVRNAKTALIEAAKEEMKIYLGSRLSFKKKYLEPLGKSYKKEKNKMMIVWVEVYTQSVRSRNLVSVIEWGQIENEKALADFENLRLLMKGKNDDTGIGSGTNDEMFRTEGNLFGKQIFFRKTDLFP